MKSKLNVISHRVVELTPHLSYLRKIQKFVIGKKSTVGDRPAARRKEAGVLTWDRMPFAAKNMQTSEDCMAQNADVSFQNVDL